MHDYDDHHDRHARGWRRFEETLRRSFRGFPFSGMNWDGLEGNFRIGRMLASGDLRLVALYLIEQQPRHGYDLIKAIEDKTAGFYSPSPGVVYPALTFLEEAGYITSTTEGNKKSYTITDEGRAHLASNRTAVESTLDYLGKIGRRWGEMRDNLRGAGPGEPGPGPADHEHGPGPHFRHKFKFEYDRPDRPLHGVIDEVDQARRELKDAIRDVARSADEETQRRLARILHKAAAKIRELESDHDHDVDL
jgi:DNA-binding PadR family transcriptional regulator